MTLTEAAGDPRRGLELLETEGGGGEGDVAPPLQRQLAALSRFCGAFTLGRRSGDGAATERPAAPGAGGSDSAKRRAVLAAVGLGRVAAFYHRSSTSYQIHDHIRYLYF
jgi:hypothetical protein